MLLATMFALVAGPVSSQGLYTLANMLAIMHYEYVFFYLIVSQSRQCFSTPNCTLWHPFPPQVIDEAIANGWVPPDKAPRPPEYVVGDNICSGCGACVKPKVVRSGQFAGYYALMVCLFSAAINAQSRQCFKTPKCSLWHPFPHEVIEEAIANGWVPPSDRAQPHRTQSSTNDYTWRSDTSQPSTSGYTRRSDAFDGAWQSHTTQSSTSNFYRPGFCKLCHKESKSSRNCRNQCCRGCCRINGDCFDHQVSGQKWWKISWH